MIAWLQRFTIRGDTAPPPAASPVRTTHELIERLRRPAVGADGAGPASALSGLLEGPPPCPGPATAAEQALLSAFDAAADAPLPTGLVPRATGAAARAVHLLQQAAPSRSAMVRLAAQDAALADEVLRLARSPLYRTRSAVETAEAAIAMLGTAGLRSAVARVLLQPAFDAPPGGLAARAAPTLRELAEQQAVTCASLAASRGGDRFDAYLAGLLHALGWMALLRIVDATRHQPTLPFSSEFDAALAARRDRMFARLATEWRLTPALGDLGRCVASDGLDAAGVPLARLLLEADRRCSAALSVTPAAQPA